MSNQTWPLTSIAQEYIDRRRQLRAAAAFVRSIPDEQFTMDHWWLPDGMAFDDWRNKMYRVANGPIGDPIGHMIQRGLFGLPRSLIEPTIPAAPRVGGSPSESSLMEAMYVQIGDCFGVSFRVAQFMFEQYAYDVRPDKNVVARRIEFIADELGV